MNDEYTVRLERVFQGPMDLLLHLVREQEVEIQEIEIGPVVEGYLAYLRDLENLDIEFAGDFLVMAATLMSIKSRSLLPREEVDLEEELDPRDELIQRLLEYKRFKEASSDLEFRERERALMHPRGFRSELKDHEEEPTLELGELTVWDLLSAFSRLMRETGGGGPHRVTTDPRPLRYYVEHLADVLELKGELSLHELAKTFDDGLTRESLIGSFCAVLELARLQAIRVAQNEESGEIAVLVREESRSKLGELVRNAGLGDEEDGDEEDGNEQAAGEVDVEPAANEGQGAVEPGEEADPGARAGDLQAAAPGSEDRSENGSEDGSGDSSGVTSEDRDDSPAPAPEEAGPKAIPGAEAEGRG